MVDVRVTRTRNLVLTDARELLAERGATAVTYSELSRRTGATRQTLYRHWPTISDLLVDALNTGPPVAHPASTGNVRADIIGFLASLRRGLDEPATASGLVALISSAEHDESAAATLRTLAVEHLKALNALLGGTMQVTATEFTRLAGPVLFRRLLQRAEVTDRDIVDTVDAFLAVPQPSPTGLEEMVDIIRIG